MISDAKIRFSEKKKAIPVYQPEMAFQIRNTSA